MEHFVFLPKQATANPQDIPFFLSTKLDIPQDIAAVEENEKPITEGGDPVTVLSRYEAMVAEVVQEMEEDPVRF